jgi:hypothetical protein
VATVKITPVKIIFILRAISFVSLMLTPITGF